MPFEKVSGSSHSSTQAKISLRKSGSIGINSVALQDYFEDYTDVELYYDRENSKIGFQPLKESTSDSYTISRSNNSGSVTPLSFLKANDLIPEITTQYEPQTENMNGDIELVVIDLSEPAGTYGSPDEDE
jgi:hypothetical protein